MKSPLAKMVPAVFGVGFAMICLAQQEADPGFDSKVARPAYTTTHPRVLFDEAHNNFHTATGRYKPFADLITSDGYQVTPNKAKFSKGVLNGYTILAISNALGAPAMNSPEAANAAFSEEECDAVRDWVQAGGNLLLIADHAPMGAANERLSLRFGVEMSKSFTADPVNHDNETDNEGFITYNRDDGSLGDHAVTRGRDANEKVSNVIVFTGQSLKGPEGSVAFLRLAATAVDVVPTPQGQIGKTTSAAGRAQGVALKFGKGRVIVLGEAAMLSAQLAGPQRMKFGMNRPGIDNHQLALNIMHWLSGLIGD
ncbi:MAG: hypothetical protein LAP85_20855 [Acidobacteriia bacterium]|nr:hypothetical protein [Terriglobia bacterium]